MSIFRAYIGIDLGTVNVLVYKRGSGIVIQEPSVVAILAREGQVVEVGEEARQMYGRTPDEIEVTRPLRDGVIADYQVTQKMLEHFVRKAKGFTLLRPLVVIGVPYGVTSVERRAVREAALAAGAGEAYLIREPLAAALGAGLPVDTATGNFVLDLGGGTAEAAVVSMNGIVVANSVRVGGIRLDEAIQNFIRRKYNLAIGEPTAEAIKIKIGSAYPSGDEREMEVKGRDLVSGIPKTVRVHSTEVREAVQEPIQQIVDAVRRALEITPPELASDIVDRGIVMTGGGALIRGLDLLLSQETGLPIHVDEDPLTCVVRGTGRILDEYEKYRSVLTR